MTPWFDVTAFGILGISAGAQFYWRSFFSQHARLVFFVAVVVVFLQSVFLSWSRYDSLSRDPLGRFLLPPYQSPAYFLSDVGYRIFSSWFLSLLAAIVVGGLAYYLNARLGDRFFEHEEIWFIRIGFFLVGYPGFLLYAMLMLFVGVLIAAFCAFGSRDRAPLRYLWLPMAFLSLVAKDFLIPSSLLGIFML